MGRIPVEETMITATPHVARWAYNLGGPIGLCGASFVDNLYFFSHSVGGALASADFFAAALESRWRLRIKPASRELLLVAGCPEVLALPELRLRWPRWRFVDTLPCLGVQVSGDGGVREDLSSWRRAVLAAVIRNAGGLTRRCLDDRHRCRLLDTVARPLLDYRAARWPVSSTTGRFVDAVQRRVILMLSRVPPLDGEDIDGWQRRRSRWAGDCARRWGLWSSRAEVRARAWLQHLRRERNHDSMASQALRWRGQEWRRQQRLAAGSARADAGRLGTRVLTHVNLRWEDSLAVP